MASVEIEDPLHLRPERIVKAIELLDPVSFDRVANQILQMRAERLNQQSPARERELLEQINQGSPPEVWKRYNLLKSRRKRGLLSADELQEMKDIYDQIEVQHSYRIRALMELSEIRKKPVEALMDELGLRTPAYE